MIRISQRGVALALFGNLALTACGGGKGASSQSMTMPEIKLPAGADYTVGDVQFMQGMIDHHGQALEMAKLAQTNGASEKVKLFCHKVTLSQADEIHLMQHWLKARSQVVPDSMGHMVMMMPGMLTPEQVKQLQAARDTTFDRLFLEFMIQHHEGALSMVATLFNSPPSGQESDIFRFATDVDNDQRAEIDAMRQMLYNLQGSATP